MATIVWPTSVSAADDLDFAWRNDTSHSDGTEDGSDTVEGFHALQHNKAALLLNALRAENGSNPSGSFVDLATRLNARQTVRKTADQTFSSTVTPAAVADLVLPVATIGLDYTFSFLGFYTSAALTNGVRLTITTPALGTGGYINAVARIYGRLAEPAAGAVPVASMVWEGFITASGDQVASDSVIAINTVYPFMIDGVLSNPSAAGNIQLQAANEVSTASGNIIKRGSYGEVYIN